MKKILIISPHFPPSNLAAVHRSRLFAQHLPESGWQPIVLAVHEKYYEESPDHDLKKLIPAWLRVEKVNACALTNPRFIGDIGLRAFYQLYKRAKQLIRKEKIDFLYILIPSFYCALLGRLLHYSTGIKYGIDYIDPWVHTFPGANKLFSRHWFSTKLANILEPVAVKKVSLITGVAEGYFEGVIKRNPYLVGQTVFGAMPYGGEKTDHDKMEALSITPYLFKKKEGKIQLVYAGAMLPKALLPLEAVFKSIASNAARFNDVEFHFIGTGKTPGDAGDSAIKRLAQKYSLWGATIYEYPARIPYLDVLAHLHSADGIFILGSTEPHYTPGKTYQAVLSGKPVLAILHKNSTALKVIKQARAGLVLDFDGEKEVEKIYHNFSSIFAAYLHFLRTFEPNQVDFDTFNRYSAENITKQLAALLDKAAANSG